MKLIYASLSIATCLLLAKHNPAPCTNLMSASCWSAEFSSGVSIKAEGSGWGFQFPGSRGWASYITAPRTAPLSGSVTVTAIATPLSGTPTYGYVFSWDPGNTCVYPAHARLYFQEAGDDLSGAGQFEFYRWFAADPNLDGYQLDSRLLKTWTTPLDPSRWISVYGKAGNYCPSPDPTNLCVAVKAAFYQAAAHPQKLGLAFGGGCFAGHGVNVLGGTAKFTVDLFSLSNQ